MTLKVTNKMQLIKIKSGTVQFLKHFSNMDFKALRSVYLTLLLRILLFTFFERIF